MQVIKNNQLSTNAIDLTSMSFMVEKSVIAPLCHVRIQLEEYIFVIILKFSNIRYALSNMAFAVNFMGLHQRNVNISF